MDLSDKSVGGPHEAEKQRVTTRRSHGRIGWNADRLIGMRAPELAVDRWLQGEASYGGAPTTVLVLCEIWDPACAEALPRLSSAEQAYANAGVQIIGLTRVTKSATDESVAAFLERNLIRFPFAKEKDASVSREVGLARPGVVIVVQQEKIVWAGMLGQLSEAPLPGKWPSR